MTGWLSHPGAVWQDRMFCSALIVPTSRRRTVRVGMQPETLCVSVRRTQSVSSGVTTQSVGTIDKPRCTAYG